MTTPTDAEVEKMARDVFVHACGDAHRNPACGCLEKQAVAALRTVRDVVTAKYESEVRREVRVEDRSGRSF